MLDFNQDVIEASHRQPVLVDFHAAWCGPCRMLGPVIDQVVKTAPGPLKLVKIDTDANQDVAVAAGVSGIPDLRLFVDGRQVAQATGFQPEPRLRAWLAEQLGVRAR